MSLRVSLDVVVGAIATAIAPAATLASLGSSSKRSTSQHMSEVNQFDGSIVSFEDVHISDSIDTLGCWDERCLILYH